MSRELSFDPVYVLNALGLKGFTEDQKQIRRTGIGGSDAAAVVGLSRYKSPVELYLEKYGEREPDDISNNEAVFWGIVLEPVVSQVYQIATGKELLKEENTIRSKKYPFMLGNFDRVIKGQNAILECKTCSAFKYKEWGADGTDEVPDEYLIQCAHYAIVGDDYFGHKTKYVDLALLMGGQHYATFTYERNKQLEESLIEAEHHFWKNNVEAGVPPPIKNYCDANILYPLAETKPKIINEDVENALEKYRRLGLIIKKYESRQIEQKIKLCSFLEEHDSLINYSGEKLATWKNQKYSRFNINKFKAEHPELYKKYQITTENRVFRVKEL